MLRPDQGHVVLCCHRPWISYRSDSLTIRPTTHEVKRSGAVIPLSRTEFLILELLMRNSGRVISRTRLIEAVWGSDRDVQSNTLDVFIRQLRMKVEAPGTPKLLHTIRGIGYTVRRRPGLIDR